MISIIKKLVNGLQAKDYLEAIGPLSMVCLFVFVLYVINKNESTIVMIFAELIFWPLYQFIGFLVENGVMNFIQARKTKKDDDYLMAVGPLLLLVGLMSLFNYSHWVLLVVSVQMIHFLFRPHDSWDQERGCINGLIKSFLLIIVFFLVLFGLQEILSEPFIFKLEYLEGGFKYLPGMMIIGIIYYCLAAVQDVLMQPLMRGAAMK